MQYIKSKLWLDKIAQTTWIYEQFKDESNWYTQVWYWLEECRTCTGRKVGDVIWYLNDIHNISHFSISSVPTESPLLNLTTAGDKVMFYLTVYGSLAGANSLFTLLRAFLFAYGGICAAQKIHKDLLVSILKVMFKPLVLLQVGDERFLSWPSHKCTYLIFYWMKFSELVSLVW